MKLKQQKKVSFDPICHQYFFEGRQLIGVTSLMAKHGLSPDYEGVPQGVLEKAAEKGTALHLLLEKYDGGESVVVKTDAEKRTIKDYKALGLDCLASEFLVSDLATTASFIDKMLVITQDTAISHFASGMEAVRDGLQAPVAAQAG